MPRTRLALSVLALTLLTSVAAAQERSQPPPPLGTASFTPPEGNTKLQPLTPETFVTRAAVTNMAEIELSELALERSADASLRAYAARLIADHQASQAKLKAAAAAAKIALPGAVDEDHRKAKQKLSEMVGAEFDKQYIALLRSGHEAAIRLLENASTSDALDAPFTGYATETLKTVKAHAATAEKLHASH